MKRILVTGGAGFIAHHFIEHVLKNTDWEVVVFDRLTYAASGFDRLRDIEAFDDRRVKMFTVDISHPISIGVASEAGPVNYIAHLAAETHVDNSISDPEPFVRANVLGTFEMLQYARHWDSLEKFLYFSTDEVFGPAPKGVAYDEWDRYDSRNPYAATKAGGEELALAWANTYKLPVVISHTMNNFGERQHHEKYLPMCIRKVLLEETISIHSDPTRTYAGSRMYIHARNVADAILFLFEHGEVREKYNIIGEREVDNLSLAQMVADIIKMPLRYEMVDFHSSRPGHDLRYALSGERLAKMGWKPPVGFEQSLERTVQWTMKHPKWLGKPVKAAAAGVCIR